MIELTAKAVADALQQHAKHGDAQFLQRFFKTGKGQYGAGDVFIGIRVPETRLVCKQFAALPLVEVQKLLDSQVHEHRLAGVILLSSQYAKAAADEQQRIHDFYLANVRRGRVNNWDLVDSSAEFIVGEHLLHRPRDLLFRLARSVSIWERRVAIVSTFQFIKKGDASTTYAIAKQLLIDKEDLIQKATGWMLRESGKRVSRQGLLQFLDKHAYEMPRTMLSYAIEHLPPEQRAHYRAQKAAKSL